MVAEQSMTEVFIYETRQFLEQLEQLALASEQSGTFTAEQVNEIFRAMHTIKGSAAMMMMNEVSSLAHSVEDIFFYIREKQPKVVDVSSITDLVLAAEDFIGTEIDKLEGGTPADGDSSEMRQQTVLFLRVMKEANGDDPDVDLRKVKPGTVTAAAAPPQQYYISPAPQEAAPVKPGAHVYSTVMFFEEGCEMEEVRAYAVLNSFTDKVTEIHYLPDKLLEDPEAAEKIKKDGFRLWFTTELDYTAVKAQLDQTIFVAKMEIKELKDVSECEFWPTAAETAKVAAADAGEPIKPVVGPSERPKPAEHHETQMISVKVDKLDRLMDLVG